MIIEKKIADKIPYTGKTKRVVCTINDDEPFQCALLPWGEGFYIIVNKKRRDKLGIVFGDKVRVILEKDESKYGLPMPEELQEVLNQDPEGDRLFHALTAGKQRSVIYHVTNVKDVDRRIHTALVFVEHLKKNDGKIVSDRLLEELKRPEIL